MFPKLFYNNILRNSLFVTVSFFDNLNTVINVCLEKENQKLYNVYIYISRIRSLQYLIPAFYGNIEEWKFQLLYSEVLVKLLNFEIERISMRFFSRY